MKNNSFTAADFLLTVRIALARLKGELQDDYEQAYPELREIIHLVLDEEESKAWSFAPFPHLIFPDLVEAHLAALNLRAIGTRHRAVPQSREVAEFPIFQPAFA